MNFSCDLNIVAIRLNGCPEQARQKIDELRSNYIISLVTSLILILFTQGDFALNIEFHIRITYLRI